MSSLSCWFSLRINPSTRLGVKRCFQRNPRASLGLGENKATQQPSGIPEKCDSRVSTVWMAVLVCSLLKWFRSVQLEWYSRYSRQKQMVTRIRNVKPLHKRIYILEIQQSLTRKCPVPFEMCWTFLFYKRKPKNCRCFSLKLGRSKPLTLRNFGSHWFTMVRSIDFSFQNSLRKPLAILGIY